jgi:HK97 family phage prohead protease
MFERSFTVNVTDSKQDNGVSIYHASLSSEEPVERFFGTEILVHDPDAADLTRASGNGLMMLYNHDVDRPLGRIKDVVITDRKRLEGKLVFDAQLPDADWIERSVISGTLDDVSLRYQIDEYRPEEDEAGHETFFITKWTAIEASVVTIPADYTGSGIGRSLSTEGDTMNTDTPSADAGNNSDPGRVNVVEFEAARTVARGEGVVIGAGKERERLDQINQLFDGCRHKTPAYGALQKECIRVGSTMDQTRAAILDLMNSEPGDTQTASRMGPDSGQPTPTPATFTAPGQTEGEKYLEGAQRALDFKAGIIKGCEILTEMRQNEFAHMSMTEMAREFLRRLGIDTRGMTRHDVVGYAMRPDLVPGGRRDLIGHGPSDFTALLANTAGKSLLIGFNETEETWQRWTRQGTLPDFKRQDRVNLSNFGDLDEIPAGGEYKAGTISDLVEYITAAKYGKLFGVYREALINDDLDGLSRAPRAMGRAGSRKIGDLVYALLTDPPTLNQDSLALFDAGHSNTGTAGAPSVATLDEMRQLMALQSDPSDSSHGLNIRPAYILVPVALETTSNILSTAEKDPAGGAGKSEAPNPFVGTFEVVADPRLDADSSVKWYMAGNQNVNDTVEVGFVNGQSEPSLESRDGWSVDGIEYKTRIEVGVSVLDFRALAYNAGA